MIAPQRIYVAGPYTQGNTSVNVRHAIYAADEVWRRGHYPFVPHLAHYWDVITQRDYEEWMDWCLRWVEASHAVLRLPGASSGGDREVFHARQHNLQVYTDLLSIPYVQGKAA